MERTAQQKSFEALDGMNCFVCAPHRLNPQGLNLVFEETENGAATRFVLPRHFQSYPGFTHGGIVSAVLDETMGYVGVFKCHGLPLTNSLSITYRSPIVSGVEYRCEASMVERSVGGFLARAFIRGEKNTDLVRAEARFTIPSVKVAMRLMGEENVEKFQDYFL